MPNLKDSRNLSRTVPAVCLVLFPVLFLAGDLIQGPDPGNTRAGLDQVAANPTPFLVGILCYMLGSALSIGGMVGVLHLLRGPGLTVGQVGATLLILGSVVTAGWFGFGVLFVVAATGPGLDRAQMAALFDAAEGSAGGTVLFVGFLVGIVLGQLLLAVGLLLRRAVPIWVPIVLVASGVLSFVVSGGYLAAIADVALLAATAGIAWRMFSLTDEQWAGQWQPPAGRAAAATDRGTAALA
jgi:hypothetical protein